MKKLVFHIGHSAGFYSEFNNMVLAILYCQRHGIEFELYSTDANFKVSKGWRDFFLPFCHETRNPIHHFINHRFEAPKGGKRKALYEIYKRLYPNSYLTSELWGKFRHIDQTEFTTVETRDLSSGIIEKIYRFNVQTQQCIDDLTSSLQLPSDYLGFHIRGGDKTSEHELLSVDVYIEEAQRLTDLRTAFVFTDDYRHIITLREHCPSWSFLTLTPETDHGYYFSEYVNLSPDKKAQKTINMFASMEVLSKAKLTLCTFSSNPGMFLGMRMGERAVGVDMKNWMIW